MINWLWRIIIGCDHVWQDEGHQNLINENGKKTGDCFYLRCKTCGDVKCRRF